MKKFTQTTIIALLISSSVFSQTKDEPVRNTGVVTNVYQADNSRLILLSPADGKLFNSSEGSKPVLFRWTAVVPKSKEAVTYRLKVWQLMQGQNGQEAMLSNQPIVTKDVTNITQTAISNLYTGPCRPPYLCDFVWAVEVLNREGVSISNDYTAGASFKFEVDNVATENIEGGNKGNAGNTGMAGGKSLDAQGDPVHGVDVKLGVKSVGKTIKDQQPAAAVSYLPVEKIMYDATGNIIGIMVKTEKGESALVKVVVAGSHSLSGGVK